MLQTQLAVYQVAHRVWNVVTCCLQCICCYSGEMAEAFKLIAADEALVTGLQTAGGAWCTLKKDSTTLKQHLAYLTSEGLPAAAIQRIADCFKLTEAGFRCTAVSGCCHCVFSWHGSGCVISRCAF